MDTIETLTERNKAFAENHFTAGLKIVPQLKTLVLGCLDPRVDPAEILGLTLGEVGVIRNVGGRVTPDVLAEIALLVTLTKNLGGALGPGWDLIVLQHTDCGILRLQEPPEQLADIFAIEPTALADKHVGDPRTAVQADIAALRDSPLIPDTFRVTGVVYDVATGLIETVAGPAVLRPDPS
ncbi:carbonic anhydrase [soil metagenome]